MVVLGNIALSLAFLTATYGLLGALVGVRRRQPALIESSRTAAYSLLALVLAANAILLAAILGNDFTIKYVAENSSRETPLFFKALSLWSAHEGSLLLWNLVLAGYLAAVAFRFRATRPETLPWALAVMYCISLFYLFLVLVPSRPFVALDQAPVDGRGPLPLLQNHWLMAVHPPFLYLGYIGFSVPFAFALASLITGSVSDWWVRVARRWTMVGVHDGWPDPWRALVVRGAGVGRLLGLGSRRERGAAPLAHLHGLPPYLHGPGADRHAEAGQPCPGRGHFLADHLRHVADACRDRSLGPRVRKVPGGARLPGLPRAGAGRGLRPDRSARAAVQVRRPVRLRPGPRVRPPG